MLPLATVATRLPEAGELTGLGERADEELARAVHALGPAHVVVTGGHSDEAIDYFFDGEAIERIPAHGTLPAPPTARAAPTHRRWRRMALGMSALEAAKMAREITAEAVAAGLRDLGSGGRWTCWDRQPPPVIIER